MGCSTRATLQAAMPMARSMRPTYLFAMAPTLARYLKSDIRQEVERSGHGVPHFGLIILGGLAVFLTTMLKRGKP